MLDAYSAWQLVQVGLIGLMAGTLGGMLGVGGSVVMIPGLVFILGRPTGVEQHLYQAAAMLANVFVAFPAMLRHRKAGAINPDMLQWMIPAALIFVMLGVTLSNLPVFSGRDGSLWLGRLLAVFLLYVAFTNSRRLIRPRTSEPPPPDLADPHATPGPRHRGPALLVGTIMGTLAGLLGIGGGAVAVPLQQALLRLPLRNCIANSSAIICVSAALGATYKISTLDRHNLPPEAIPGVGIAAAAPITWATGLTLGLLLAPTCFLGGRLGASLTHRLPLPAIRIAFIALVLVSAWKMANPGA